MSKPAKTFCKAFRQGESGFTLIELLVVVAILGALAAVVILNVGSFIGRGVCEGYCTEKHNVQTAVVAAMTTEDEDDSWEDYIIGGTKYNWTTSVNETTGVVSDASDAPTEDCPCKDAETTPTPP